MKFVGIDLHKQTIVLCVVGQDRKVLERQTFHCADVERIRAYFAQLGTFRAVVEATASYEWLVDLIEPLAERVVLAHPGKLRVIAESVRKNDKLDAQVLAEFLALDMIPLAYQPTRREREHRVLVRHRVLLRRECTRLKCRIRRVLSNYNADRKSLFTKDGWAYLQEVKLSASDRFALDQWCAALLAAEKRVRDAQQRLRKFAAEGPSREQEARELLRSIPGVGEVVAEVVLAELGDVSRFGSLKKVYAYSGLVPRMRASAGKSKDLGITKQGPRLLRWILVEAGWQCIRYSLRWENIYQRLKKRRGSKRAIVAVARRLLGVMVALLRSGEPYRMAKQEKPQTPLADETTV